MAYYDPYSRRGMEPEQVFGLSLTVAILLGSIFMCGTGTAGCGNSLLRRYDVVGTVAKPPDAKVSIGTEGGSSKFAVTLGGIEAPNRPPAFRGDYGIVNCDSTQCATLEPGSRVALSCFEEWALAAPNEEECRFARVVTPAAKP